MKVAMAVRIVSLVGAMAILGGCQPSATTSTLSTRTLSQTDLPRIIVTVGTLPAGWTIDSSIDTPSEIAVYPTRSAAARMRAQAAAATLVAGRVVEGVAPEGIFVAFAALFQDAAAAERALTIYQDDFLASGAWGLNGIADRGLHDSAVRFTGETTRLVGGAPGDPVPSRIYLWQVDNLVLAVGGFFDADAETLRSIAKDMDARAR